MQRAQALGKRLRWVEPLYCYRGANGAVVVAPDPFAADALIYGSGGCFDYSRETDRLPSDARVTVWKTGADPVSSGCCEREAQRPETTLGGHRAGCPCACETKTASEWVASRGFGVIGLYAETDEATAPAHGVVTLASLPPIAYAAKPRRRAGRTTVCLIGSCRFYGAFREAEFSESLAGRIVLSVGFHPGEEHSELAGITPEQKADLDDLHLDKVALADEVLVLNVGGYLGPSVTAQLAHAIDLGKRLRWLEPLHCYTNDTDTVVAHDVEEAARMIFGEEEATRMILGEEDLSAVRQLPDDGRLAIWQDDPPKPTLACCLQRRLASRGGALGMGSRPQTPNGHYPRCPVGCPEKTHAQWAAEGPGHLCSTDA